MTKAASDILETLTADSLFPHNPHTSQDPQEDLRVLDIVISRVEDLLATLIQERPPFKLKINDLKSPIIRLLPPEILSHIFTLSLTEFREVNLNRITAFSIVSPFLLGSICRRWRDVAWSTPELWSTMFLHLSEWNLKDAGYMVEEWLKRSGHLPLSIRLSCDPRSSGSHDLVLSSKEQVTALIAILRCFADRWYYLDIRLPTFFYPAFNAATLSASCPLNYLYVDPPDGQSDSTHALSINPIAKLTKLRLCSVYLKSMTISWNNLTHVFAISFYVDECLEILRRCPQLICCKFPYIMAGEEPLYHFVDEPPIVMPCTRFLQIGQDKELPTSAILDKLVLPSLEAFNFDGSGCIDFDGLVVSSLFARSECNLLSFTLKDAPMPDAQLESILAKLPSLQRLFINGSDGIGLTIGLLSRLADSSADPASFLPALETLGYTGPRNFDWNHLSSLLQLPSTSLSSKPFTSGISGDAHSSITYHSRERLRAVNLALSSTSERGIDSFFLVPLIIRWLGLGRQFELSNCTFDLVESWIEEHSAHDMDIYNSLKKQTSGNAGRGIPEDVDEWTV